MDISQASLGRKHSAKLAIGDRGQGIITTTKVFALHEDVRHCFLAGQSQKLSLDVSTVGHILPYSLKKKK